MKSETGALRYNEGKVRYSLLPKFALEQVARVFTYGCQKYNDYNWKKGLNWTDVCDSLERHLQAWKSSEDFDKESGLYHLAHLATNALFLLEYYKIFPQGDNRNIMPMPKIGLDIDDVLADFCGAWQNKWGYEPPLAWEFSYSTKDKFASFSKDEYEQFIMSLHPKVSPLDIPFEPHCYITSRSVDSDVTKAWLEKHRFPTKPVYTVGHGMSKLEVAKQSGIDWFVDDSYTTFKEFNDNGICCFLFDMPHNQRFDVGFKRIHSLTELKW